MIPGGRHLERYRYETLSGRFIDPPDVSLGQSASSATRALRLVHAWLIEQAIEEAIARKDDHARTLFEGEKSSFRKELPQASVDSMNEYLFGGSPKLVLQPERLPQSTQIPQAQPSRRRLS